MTWRFFAGGWLAVLVVLTCMASEGRAEFRLYPALTLSEIYNDNIFNDPNDRVSEFVTRVMPSIGASYAAARLEADLTYTLDYRYYLKDEQEDEGVHLLDARALATLYRETFFLEVENELSRVSLDAARDFRDESLFLNQSDRNAFSVSPYFQLEPTPQTRLRGGYEYVRITFDDGGVDRTDHIFFVEASRDLSARTTAVLGARYLDEDNDETDFRKRDVSASLRSALSETLYVIGTVGYAWVDFDNGVTQDDLVWDASIHKDFVFLVAGGGLGVRYTEDPIGTIFREEYYRVSLSRDWERSRLAARVHFADFIETERDDLDTRRLGGGVSFNHELTPLWSLLAEVDYDRFDDEIEDTETRRFIYYAAMTYQFSSQVAATLGYSHIDSHSPELESDRYRTNRVMLELHMVY